eukprot:1160342-Pelagomonas_calceolata.AAC.5
MASPLERNPKYLQNWSRHPQGRIIGALHNAVFWKCSSKLASASANLFSREPFLNTRGLDWSA